MTRRSRLPIAIACVLWAFQAGSAQAQWGYPGGYGDFGWGGWGGASTIEGDIARGMGVFAAGAGVYNKQTAIGNSINADTVMRWNEYLYQSQMNANRRATERRARAREANIQAHAEMQRRLRENPQPADIFRGSAMNVVLDDVTSPRVYAGAVSAANAKISTATIRSIPFQYSAAAITLGLHQLASGTWPAPLRRPDFDADRALIAKLDAEILAQVEDEKEPNLETVKALLDAIVAAEQKATKLFFPNGIDAKQSTTYLKALHGLVLMLKAPKLDDYLAGIEKRPETSLGELLRFMTSFNLRFGVASTPQQRDAYSAIFPKLVELRKQLHEPKEVAAPATTGAEAQDFYAGMSLEDLGKKAAKP